MPNWVSVRDRLLDFAVCCLTKKNLQIKLVVVRSWGQLLCNNVFVVGIMEQGAVHQKRKVRIGACYIGKECSTRFMPEHPKMSRVCMHHAMCSNGSEGSWVSIELGIAKSVELLRPPDNLESLPSPLQNRENAR